MAGIDYGMGQTNINHETGIRFGVISMHDILQAWADSSEGYYGEPTCPKCGNPASAADDDTRVLTGDVDEDYEYSGCADYACDDCRYVFDSSEAFSEEALSFSVDDGTYKAESCLDSDVMVLESPFYTFAPFCSPCVPGAGSLNNAETPTDGDMSGQWPKVYCFGHDWFDDGKAPYRVFRVADGVEVFGGEE